MSEYRGQQQGNCARLFALPCAVHATLLALTVTTIINFVYEKFWNIYAFLLLSYGYKFKKIEWCSQQFRQN